MTANKHKQTLENRATAESASKAPDCAAHPEQLVFALRAADGRLFSVGMSTILQCVAFAIERGELPKLPSNWLIEVQNRLRLDLTTGADIWYNEEKSDGSG